MSSNGNEAFVRSVLSALSRGDWDVVENAFADDAVVWVAGAMPISGTHTKEFVAEAGRRTKTFFPDGLSLTVKATTVEGERVAVEAESLGTHTSGKTYNNHFHILLVVRDGRIHEWKEYMDTMHANDVLFGGH